jgi:hypothetical protein
MQRLGSVELLLRIGVAFAFIYPAVAAYFDPFSWIGFFPVFLRDLVPNESLLLHAFGISEIAIALWILIGKRIFIPSVLAALYLAGIIVFNLSLFDIIFRDFPILLIAVALAMLHYEKHALPTDTTRV